MSSCYCALLIVVFTGADFHVEIIPEMGELGILGATIPGREITYVDHE